MIFNFVLQGRWLAVLLVAALGAGLVAPAWAEGYASFAERLVSHPPDGIAVAADVEALILMELNSYRASKGRKPLRAGPEALQLAARAQAMDLMQTAQMGHGASTGHSFEGRMRAMLGTSMLPAMAENAARDRRAGVDTAGKAKGLMAQWVKSPHHRKSLTDRTYVSVAIGAVRRGDHVYAVQIFSGPAVKTNFMIGQ